MFWPRTADSVPMGRSIALPPVPEGLLAEGFRRAVLEFLVKARAIPDELRSRLRGSRAPLDRGESSASRCAWLPCSPLAS
jgi:hypothetical protein